MNCSAPAVPASLAAVIFLGLAGACSAPAEPSSNVIAVPPPPPAPESAQAEDATPAHETETPSAASHDELSLLDRARMDNVRVETESIAMAIELWQSSHPDQCPRFDDLIKDRVLPPEKSNEDPWRQPYSIECKEAGPTVRSNGPDELPGTQDDVSAGPSS